MRFSKFKLKYIKKNQNHSSTIQKSFAENGVNKRLNFHYVSQKKLAVLDRKLVNLFNVPKKKRDIARNVFFLIKIKTYKGNRHKKNLPCRGQRTHTNAKTRKKFKYVYSKQKTITKK